MNPKSVSELDLDGRRVLVRCDFNVPLKEGQISDDTRIKETLPTINYLISKGAKIVLCSHLGRPKGEKNLKYSLKPVAARLGELLGVNVQFCPEIVGKNAESAANSLQNGQIMLLENLRFYKEEEQNDENFCRELAKLADIYINDAFGTAHRAHASTAGVARFIPISAAGLLMEKEIKFLSKALENAQKPYVAIIGGAKVSDKLGIIKSLIKRADTVLIGGGMAFTFLAAQGIEVGNSLVENDKKELALSLIEEAKNSGVKLLLPTDFVAAASFPNPIDAVIEHKYIDLKTDKFGELMGLDIGKNTIKMFCGEIENAATIVWNGPMGVAENPIFCAGTKATAEAIGLRGKNALSIIGGGDSAAAINALNIGEKISHISTGGGASLEFLEGKTLPGIAVLLK